MYLFQSTFLANSGISIYRIIIKIPHIDFQGKKLMFFCILFPMNVFYREKEICLVGILEIGGHVPSDLDYPICLRHLLGHGFF